MNLDAVYTPEKLAKRLIDEVTSLNVKSVADFAVGEGALLSAASKRWPSSKLIGCDIRPEVLNELGNRCSNVEFICADFYDQRFFSTELGLRSISSVDLVVLNPPFSSKRVVNCVVGDAKIKCSPPAFFILSSLQHLKPQGELVALIPDSFLFSERDFLAREALSKLGKMDVLWREPRAFDGHSVAVSGIRFTKGALGQNSCSNARIAKTYHGKIRGLRRGTLAVNKARSEFSDLPNSVPFIHTTNLKNTINYDLTATVLSQNPIRHHGLLIARVGRPSLQKVVYFSGKKPIALSDCVFWLTTGSRNLDQKLLRSIRHNFDEFSEIYGGSCASYTTKKKLQTYLGLSPNFKL